MLEARGVLIYWEATQLGLYLRREQKAELYQGNSCQRLAAERISAAVHI